MKFRFHVLMAIAYTPECERDRSRDEWEVEDVDLPEDRDLVRSFAANRYPKAIYVKAERLVDFQPERAQ